jgi:hypothetical protein
MDSRSSVSDRAGAGGWEGEGREEMLMQGWERTRGGGGGWGRVQ